MTLPRSTGGDATAAAHEVGHVANAVAGSPWTGALMRFGFVARGIIYLLPGYVALRLAAGGAQGTMTQAGAIASIGAQPSGHFVLVGIAVGLAGYALWGMVRAIFDPLRDGHSTHGVLKRLGYLSSALAYGGLLAGTLRFLGGALPRAASPRDWTAALLSKPFGHWLVAIVGLCWIVGGGVTQILSGWKLTFADDLDLDRLGSTERAIALGLGRWGIIARGIVFSIIGLFLIAAAWHGRAGEAQGMDGALLALIHEPYGRTLLGTVAVGLMMFGVFSIACARWMRVRVPDHGSMSPSHPPTT